MALSPMMQHYLLIKKSYPGCILFYRVGDFFEMFFEDAELVSRELELTLTGKDCGLEERAPMCGVPHHAAKIYAQRLIEKGYRVAVCEQLSDPATSKGLVKRDVIRIFTPGTGVDPELLDGKNACYVLCVGLYGKGAFLCYGDASTGEVFVHQLPDAATQLRDEIARIAPKEIITSKTDRVTELFKEGASYIEEIPEAWFQRKNAESILTEQFKVQNITALGFENGDKLALAAGALLRYYAETQHCALEHIRQLTFFDDNRVMQLDQATRRNLELTESQQSRSRQGSLLWLLDKTHTAMGARLLREWVENPRRDMDTLNTRLDAVEALKNAVMESDDLGLCLQDVSDMERLLSKISLNSLNGRDCLALLKSLRAIKPVRDLLDHFDCTALKSLAHTLTPLDDLCDLIEKAINPNCPIALSDGNVIRDGYNEKLDEYRCAGRDGKQWLLDLETREREQTGIKSLHIRSNNVFGYYLEVTRNNLNLVPDRYIRRQTLTSGERFTTAELKEIERKITDAENLSLALESELFTQLRDTIALHISAIQQNATVLKTADVLLSLATVARDNFYVKPHLNDEGILKISEGRHPIVEKMLQDAEFVPNDALLDLNENRMLIITGPNMAGKSTYMRQVALITLMAHIGSFVPATEADICLCDRIFTRIGASDDLAGGKSTFMVEMSETAAILRNATARSLVLLDEIGRGTSTFDGLAIAWAVVEYLLNKDKIGAKTLFATHYHELSELEGRFEGVRNYCISVMERGEDIIFLRKIIPGGADRSYGVQVARLAGVPKGVIARAREIQARLEVSDINQETISSNILENRKKKDKQMDLFHLGQDELLDELRQMDVLSMTPMQALDVLFKLREKARKLN